MNILLNIYLIFLYRVVFVRSKTIKIHEKGLHSNHIGILRFLKPTSNHLKNVLVKAKERRCEPENSTYSQIKNQMPGVVYENRNVIFASRETLQKCFLVHRPPEGRETLLDRKSNQHFKH
ncbi:hypothetical protein L596_030388 [Steinernema carpocapsae]|uniref:Uncharacterized protein n=1 Tax=Steinernema carpocapsae TaxID=34508 RepID=A0A4U5LP92_STECR|nr:hypothetical protein L596_030388 [Steinernema carpocapsae]